MLASPLLPSPMFSTVPAADDHLRYRPSADLDSFNSLLPPPVEFIEGSSSGIFAIPDGRYEPINGSAHVASQESPPQPSESSAKPQNSPARPAGAKPASLYNRPVQLHWPLKFNLGAGLNNIGNTCFLNSALQCLIHTPPLLHILINHTENECRVPNGTFCMTCSLRSTTSRSYSGRSSFTPQDITRNLYTIAKHMRRGRQEDSHEFLRYAIDALQKSCLAGYSPKLDPKIQETTWVHKLFGGKLRSRVSCKNCGHNSDTFDSILDLSLDIHKCDSLKDALKAFIAIDHLKGADKYKCEKCQKHVNAEKSFTIHEAPPVLTVHLKRFSPLGRKVSHHLDYDADLNLQPYMSAGAFGPSYSLYAVICHAGSGPNSGHYYAMVKSKEGRWHEMNDESVTPCHTPTSKKSAYMLFYLQNKGQGLDAAVKAQVNGVNGVSGRVGLVAGMKRKQAPKERSSGLSGVGEDDEDQGVKVESKFIGPLLPSPEITVKNGTTPPASPSDPQAALLKSKIQALARKKPSALESLGGYDSDEEGDLSISKEEVTESQRTEITDNDKTDKPSSPAHPPTSPPPSSPPPPPAAAVSSSTTDAVPISSSSFYAPLPSKPKKRKSPDTDSDNHQPVKKATMSTPLASRTTGYNIFNLPSQTYKKKKTKRFGI